MLPRSPARVLALAFLSVACSGKTGPPTDGSPCEPVDDDLECTEDVCEGDEPVHENLDEGVECSDGVCDGHGECVECTESEHCSGDDVCDEGSCVECATNKDCSGGEVCDTDSSTCGPASTCTDDERNGDETDVDCGGSCAPTRLCDDGASCETGDDCASGVCEDDQCAAPSCGDGVRQGNEACDDGNHTNGDGCDDGTGNVCRPTGCGNGAVATGEQCDDGNDIDGDDCDNNCTFTACGNGIITSGEECDDEDDNGGDGCSATCQVEPGYTCTMTPSECSPTCGDDLVLPGEECDDAAPAESGDGCSAACTLEDGYDCAGSPSICTPICGDGEVVGGEACDDASPAEDGDGCSATCTVEQGYQCSGSPSTCVTVCGDSLVAGDEACDDGNLAIVDGCTPLCQAELFELEPNDDGSVATGAPAINGNDFDAGGIAVANALAQGAFDVATGESTAFIAALAVAGDEDVYAITNSSATTPYDVRFDVWNRASGYGVNVACGSSIDMGLTIRDSAGASLISNDDRGSSSDRCPGLKYELLPGETVFAHAVDFDDDDVVPGYGLQIVPTPIICGNGWLTAGVEECDDGNLDDSDGCSSTCMLEGTISETEPNDTSAEADATGILLTSSATLRNAIGPATDLDTFRIQAASTSVVRFETFAPLFGDCNTSATTLRLLSDVGTQIIAETGFDNASGIRDCGAIVFPLDAGTYYIRAEETGQNATIAEYVLQASFATSSGSENEPAGTVGENDSNATAETLLLDATDHYVYGDHTVEADVDVYAITLPPGSALRAEIIEGDRALKTCESTDLDSRLTLFDAAGAELSDDDDDGRGFCSVIDGTGTTPRDSWARNLTGAPAVYYLWVRGSELATGGDGSFTYRLHVTVR